MPPFKTFWYKERFYAGFVLSYVPSVFMIISPFPSFGIVDNNKPQFTFSLRKIVNTKGDSLWYQISLKAHFQYGKFKRFYQA